jgi:sulfatase maturation enzyme AslB (radical SAM superfamily)
VNFDPREVHRFSRDPLQADHIQFIPIVERTTSETLFACYGNCRRNRFIATPDDELGLNYLCASYELSITI